MPQLPTADRSRLQIAIPLQILYKDFFQLTLLLGGEVLPELVVGVLQSVSSQLLLETDRPLELTKPSDLPELVYRLETEILIPDLQEPLAAYRVLRLFYSIH